MNAKVIIFFALVALAVAEEAKPEAKAEAKPVEAKKDKRGLVGLGYGAGWNSALPISSYSTLGAGVLTPSLGLTDHISSVTITKEVPVPVPHPIAVPIEKHIAVPVKVPYAVPIDRPYPVHVPKPYPVEVTRHVPIAVDRPYPVPAPYAVKVHVPAPYPVAVPQPYAVPVVKHVPLAVHPEPIILERKNGWHSGISHYSSW